MEDARAETIARDNKQRETYQAQELEINVMPQPNKLTSLDKRGRGQGIGAGQGDARNRKAPVAG